jgi:hypothetical protein
LLARFAPLLSSFFRAPLPPSQNLLAASISRDIEILSFPLLLSYFLWTLAICFVCCYSSSEFFFRFSFSVLLVCLIVSAWFSTPGWWSSVAATAVWNTQVFLCWVF